MTHFDGERDSTLRDVPLGRLFERLGGELSRLLRAQFDLLRAEMTGKMKGIGARVGAGAGALVAAALFGFVAFTSLGAAAVLLLALAMPAWGAALIVAAVYGVIAAILAAVGARTLRGIEAPVPTRTIETVKEDVAWIKTQTSSAKR